MKWWFHHKSAASNDEALSAVITEHGWEGYGVWWRLVECIASNMTGDNPCYSLPVARWVQLFGIRPNKLFSMFETFEKYGLIEVETGDKRQENDTGTDNVCTEKESNSIKKRFGSDAKLKDIRKQFVKISLCNSLNLNETGKKSTKKEQRIYIDKDIEIEKEIEKEIEGDIEKEKEKKKEKAEPFSGVVGDKTPSPPTDGDAGEPLRKPPDFSPGNPEKPEATRRAAAGKKSPLTVEFDWETGTFVNITPPLISAWRAAYPAVDVDGEIKRAAIWQLSNPSNRKKNYMKFLSNWLSRTQERARPWGNTTRPSGGGFKTPQERLDDNNKAVFSRFLGCDQPVDKSVDNSGRTYDGTASELEGGGL